MRAKALFSVIVFAIFMLLFQEAEAKGMFKLSSNSITNGATLHNEQVYAGFGCSGANISPDLHWENPPTGTKSYALVVHDPDAPKENGWYHWIVINIPISKTSLAKGERAILPSLETLNDFNQNAYGGACPPKGHGKHHYNFTIYALNVDKLDVPINMAPKKLEDLIKSHAIKSDTITATYGR